MEKRNGKDVIYIGYWQEREGDGLPMPVENSATDNTQAIALLKEIIAHPKTQTLYCKGSSPCRCCKKSNGSEEHRIALKTRYYVIPGGYMHYLEEHNVQASPEIEVIYKELFKK